MSENNKGALPPMQVITLESNSDQWRLLANKLIPTLSFIGIVEKSGGGLVKINIEISEVIPPENLQGVAVSNEVHIDSRISKSVGKICGFFTQYAYQRVWLLVGTIKGGKEHPIVISHYEVFNFSVYAIQTPEERTFLLTQFGKISMN